MFTLMCDIFIVCFVLFLFITCFGWNYNHIAAAALLWWIWLLLLLLSL